MAMKLTFEADFKGAEQIQSALRGIQKATSDAGLAGEKMAQQVNAGMGTLEKVFTNLNKQGAGADAFTKSLGDMGKAMQSFIGEAQVRAVENLNKALQGSKDSIKSLIDESKKLKEALTVATDPKQVAALKAQLDANAQSMTIVASKGEDAMSKMGLAGDIPGAPGGGGRQPPGGGPINALLSALGMRAVGGAGQLGSLLGAAGGGGMALAGGLGAAAIATQVADKIMRQGPQLQAASVRYEAQAAKEGLNLDPTRAILRASGRGLAEEVDEMGVARFISAGKIVMGSPLRSTTMAVNKIMGFFGSEDAEERARNLKHGLWSERKKELEDEQLLAMAPAREARTQRLGSHLAFNRLSTQFGSQELETALQQFRDDSGIAYSDDTIRGPAQILFRERNRLPGARDEELIAAQRYGFQQEDIMAATTRLSGVGGTNATMQQQQAMMVRMGFGAAGAGRNLMESMQAQAFQRGTAGVTSVFDVGAPMMGGVAGVMNQFDPASPLMQPGMETERARIVSSGVKNMEIEQQDPESIRNMMNQAILLDAGFDPTAAATYSDLSNPDFMATTAEMDPPKDADGNIRLNPKTKKPYTSMKDFILNEAEESHGALTEYEEALLGPGTDITKDLYNRMGKKVGGKVTGRGVARAFGQKGPGFNLGDVVSAGAGQEDVFEERIKLSSEDLTKKLAEDYKKGDKDSVPNVADQNKGLASGIKAGMEPLKTVIGGLKTTLDGLPKAIADALKVTGGKTDTGEANKPPPSAPPPTNTSTIPPGSDFQGTDQPSGQGSVPNSSTDYTPSGTTQTLEERGHEEQ